MQSKGLKLHRMTKTPKSKAGNCTDSLKILEANTYTLYLKTQYYHWNVTGPNFQSLHELFEKQYKELAEAVDVLAERIRTLGEIAPGSFQEFISLKTIPEAKQGLDAMEMIEDLKKSHEMLCLSIEEVLKQSHAGKDPATENILADRLETHQKNIWMLNSHLV